MKKTMIFAAVLAGMLSPVIANAAGQDIPLSISGTLVNSAVCTVDAPANLAFDNIDASDIYTAEHGATAHSQVYSILFSNCPAGQAVNATLMGTADSDNAALLSIDKNVEGAAKNVGIAFIDGSQVLAPNIMMSGNQTHTINTDGTSQIFLQADVVKVGSSVTVVPGVITASANVKVNFL